MSSARQQTQEPSEDVEVIMQAVVCDYPRLVTTIGSFGLIQPGAEESVKRYLIRAKRYRHDIFRFRDALLEELDWTVEQFNAYFDSLSLD